MKNIIIIFACLFFACGNSGNQPEIDKAKANLKTDSVKNLIAEADTVPYTNNGLEESKYKNTIEADSLPIIKKGKETESVFVNVILNKIFHLEKGKLAFLGEKGMTYQIKEIRDSRCPPNVNCIRAGELEVDLLVIHQNKEKVYTLTYPTNEKPNSVSSVKIDDCIIEFWGVGLLGGKKDEIHSGDKEGLWGKNLKLVFQVNSPNTSKSAE